MSESTVVKPVNDQNIADVLGADRGVLLLTKSTCGSCASYQKEIEAQYDRGRLNDVVIGKIVLDQPGAGQFKRANPWIAELEHLPYTVLYRNGERVDQFEASKGSYLVERVEDVLATSPAS